jgi:hypothetical protein
MAQAKPRQARLKVTAAGKSEIDTGTVNRGLVIGRVVKGGCAAGRHPLRLGARRHSAIPSPPAGILTPVGLDPIGSPPLSPFAMRIRQETK